MTQTTDCLFITSSKARAVQFSVYPYLGVGYLSSFLKKKNLNSSIYDVDVNKSSVKKIIRHIRVIKPMVVGYSMMSISLPLFYRITREIRKNFPEMIIVAGGPHVTNDPAIVFDMDIDYGFSGHSEESFPLFLERLKNKDTTFSDIGGIIINKDKTVNPPAFFDVSGSEVMPDYSIYNLNRYQNIFYGRRWFTMITARGCAFNCKFCKDPGKEKYREYPLASIKKQIRTLVVDYKLNWISFVDDSFTYNRKRVIELCNFIISEGLKFHWTCCTRVDVLDAELIQLMKKAGLYYVIIGVESGNEEIRKGINKNIPTSTYIDIIDTLNAAGVKSLCSYVLGNPNETYDQIRETINFSLKLKANYAQFYNMTALPQSPIFQYGIDEGVFGERVWTAYMKNESKLPYYIPEGLKGRKLAQLRTYAFLRYYLRPRKFFDLGSRLFKFFFDMSFRTN